MNLRRCNNVLTAVVVGVALYMIVAPMWPWLKWQLAKGRPAPVYSGELAASVGVKAPKPVPDDNRIVIPSARIDQPILEGSNLALIDNGGSWHKPLNTASPKDSGNTVIIGHRFTYTNPEGAFYNLDKVKVGDKLALYWQKEELVYEVTEITTVAPTAVEVERNSTDRRLTLYTCTPLVTASNRLVVIAKPVEKKS
jgi:LPXTG-site transpeptidase (sortase) family protein